MMKPNLRFIGRSTIILLILLAAIFLRGDVRDFTVLGLLVAVVAYNLFVFLRPKWMLTMQKFEEQREAARALNAKKKAPASPSMAAPAQQRPVQPAPQAPAAPAPAAQAQPVVRDAYRDTLVRHVNYRITEKLKNVFPDATWSWTIADPVPLIQKGGTTRIRTFHTEGHNFAEVEFSSNGNFRICMIQVTELDGSRKAADQAKADAGSDTDNINLYDWYELTAQAVIHGTIDEVHTRGHKVLYIDASGDVFTKEGDENVKQGKISFMPSAKLWEELVPLFAGDDITATIDGELLALTWGN